MEQTQVENIAAEIVATIQALDTRTTEKVRAVRRQYSRKLAKEPPEVIIQLGLRLLVQSDFLYRGDFLYRFVAYELVAHHRAALASLDREKLEQFGQGLDSWWSVDTFAPYLSGPAWRQGQISDEVIHAWARSEVRWWRRAALVSTVALNNQARGGRGDSGRTLAICRILVADRDDMVVKAMSWALRELAKRDPDAVRAFLAENEKALAARVNREVQNKLSTGLKNPRNK